MPPSLALFLVIDNGLVLVALAGATVETGVGRTCLPKGTGRFPRQSSILDLQIVSFWIRILADSAN